MFQINKMPEKIDIGIIGETNFRTHKFDMSPWMQDTPDGVPSIIVIRPEETEADAYIAATEFDRETNVLSWTITAGDLGEVAGEGVMRIWLEEEDNEETIVKRGKSVKVTTIINEDETRDPSDEPPEAQEAWMEQMTALKVATVDAAADADDAKDDAEAAAALAEGSAEDAEAYAIGKRNGEDVTSGDPAYHNNSKYYAIKAWEHAGDAENAKIDAVAAKNAAVGAKNDAVSAKNDAVSAKNDAVTAQGAAEYAQGKAEDAQDAAEDAQTAAENAQGAAEGSAKDAEAWAVGERGGVPVTSGDETYENNAKYYAEEAASTLANKADKADTVLTTTLSRGRKSGTTVGTGSFAFGDNVEASGYMSFAKGALTKASGADASAEGSAAFAEGQASHAEGRSTIASGKASHSEGQQTTASGDNSHAEGYLTTAEGNQSHAEGEYTKATHAAQHVFGAYNALDTSTNDSDAHGNFIEIVGNGFNSSNKRNARTLSWLGDERLLGNLFVGANANGTGGHKVARADTTAVQGNFAMFDNGGNPVDSGHKHSDYLTEHQDISGKADKVTGATNGNLAGLDGDGNLTDSGKKASDFVEGDDFYATEMPMSSSDSTKVSEAVSGLKSQIDGKADLIRDTVQNVAIASVPDGAANLPLTALKFKVEPIQPGSGDPYPAGGSKNLFGAKLSDCKTINTNGTWTGDSYALAGVTFAVEKNNEGYIVGIKTSGTASETIVFNVGEISLANGISYILNGLPSNGSNTTFGFQLYISGSSPGNYYHSDGDTVTPSSDLTLLLRLVIRSGYNASNLTFKPMIRLSTVSDSTFVPYSNIRPITGRTQAVVSQSDADTSDTTTHTVQFGSTVYGASVDYVEGQADDELTMFEFDGSEDESWVANGANGYYITVGATYQTTQTPISNYLVCLTNGASSGLGTWQGRMNTIVTTAPTNFLVKPDMETYDTLAKWKTFLSNNPLHVLLKKATPTTISLTVDEIKTAQGVNNLWSDCGDIVELTYGCDTKQYVEKRLSASQTLMELIVTANREDGMKATKAYTTGNLLIVNGTLYRATTSIANGATLTPGTNVTATTVAAELAALA